MTKKIEIQALMDINVTVEVKEGDTIALDPNIAGDLIAAGLAKKVKSKPIRKQNKK